MYYVLHHSKGALMLAAENLHQVIQWSRRQLGDSAGLISVTESDCQDTIGMVEKDGTGIRAEHGYGCIPVLSVTANSIQRVTGFDDDDLRNSNWCRDSLVKTGNPTVH